MIAAFVLSASLAVVQAGPVTTQRIDTPHKALQFEVVVPASLDEVWQAMTTEAGLETWLWKDARVDLRPGGDWLVLYTPTATGGGTIVYDYLSRGNAQLLAQLHRRFTSGPLDWSTFK